MPKKAATLPVWPHVPRPALAQRYLRPAMEFGVRAMTLFAPRGIGKTEFLRRDLIPLAREHNFLCIHCDLWASSEGPMSAIARALESSDTDNESLGGTERLVRRAQELLKTPITKTRAEFQLLGHKAAVEAAFPEPKADSSGDEAERLMRAFKSMVKRARRRPVLLVIDEAQTLAMSKAEPLVRTLRSLFEAHSDEVTRMFTGSSRLGLERMFRRSRAPLFGQGGNLDAFPPLERDFIRAIAEWFNERTGGAVLGEAAAWAAFERLHRSARLFRSAVEAVLVGQAPNIAAASELARYQLVTDESLKLKLTSLSPLQSLILQAVWRLGTNLYSSANIKALGRVLGRQVEAGEVQAALQRLERLELIDRIEHGAYEIEMPELALLFEDLVARSER